MTGKSLSEIKTPAEIAAIAAKGYKQSAATQIVEKLSKQKLSPESSAGYILRLKNLTGPRTLEGRMKSLNNLTAGNAKKPVDDGITLLDEDDPLRELLLNDSEVNFYQNKKAKYEAEFKFNSSSDQLVLEQILLEEINLFRLRKAQKDYNVKLAKGGSNLKNIFNPNRQITESIKNLKTLIEKLAVDRKQRTGGKDSIGDDVATLSQVYEKEYTDQKYYDSETAKKADEAEQEEINKFLIESEEKKIKAFKEMNLM